MCNETTEALVCENLFDEVNLTISRFNMMLDQYYTAFCGDISSHLREVLDVQISTLETHLVSLSGIKCQLENEIKKNYRLCSPLGSRARGRTKGGGVSEWYTKREVN